MLKSAIHTATATNQVERNMEIRGDQVIYIEMISQKPLLGMGAHLL